MIIKSTFLLCVFLTFVSAEIRQPRDVADVVKEELEALASIVQGRILVAHDDLNNALTTFKTNSINVASQGTISIQQLQQTIDTQLQQIKDFAHAADVDISACTNIREQTLNRFPDILIGELNTYIDNIVAKASSTIDDGTYLVDIVINKVHNLDFQLSQCGGDLLCINSLLTEIELDKVRLPQSIETEVQAVESVLTNLRISVQSNTDWCVSQYISGAFDILRDIQNCANHLVG
ncbi:uncharacterized protein LOC135127018 [Zophobas morio]|uniref:uncharacterized protein LOC135127018 n=1 Tax=Zophobas morio TaxID=2755281 RepID=UPI003082B650